TLVTLHPGLSLVEICMKLAGRKGGGVIALNYIYFFIQMASWITRNLGDFMKVILMPCTPISVFHIMFLVVVCYASIKGLETIARVSQLLTPVILLILAGIFAASLMDWRWTRFQPALQLDIWTVIKGSAPVLGFPYMEVVVL